MNERSATVNFKIRISDIQPDFLIYMYESWWPRFFFFFFQMDSLSLKRKRGLEEGGGRSRIFIVVVLE